MQPVCLCCRGLRRPLDHGSLVEQSAEQWLQPVGHWTRGEESCGWTVTPWPIAAQRGERSNCMDGAARGPVEPQPTWRCNVLGRTTGSDSPLKVQSSTSCKPCIDPYRRTEKIKS
ncbi:hypothetical protein NDU88_004577 [Pleurodeles waltl]|uniref:Uncharacterized protein n=1 Tax=Pleurodeles waltl TaxID=8319 RepID=A0AAV7SJC1_PLEWA|nr:hypothetical protein NDU88_004577 [Pleurodeles waltl]